MSNQNLEELFKRAAAIAAVVPESMQEAAFHRALDALQGHSGNSGPSKPDQRSPGSRRLPETDETQQGVDPVQQLLQLERSRAEAVDDEEGGLNKALALLRVAHRELQIDGLSAPQIATVLTEKFRWGVSRQAITQALDGAGRLVDRTRGPRGAAMYRIMGPGETYLDSPAEGRSAPPGGRRTPTRKVRKSTAKRSGSQPRAARTETSSRASKNDNARRKPSGARSSRGRTGPKAAVEGLIAEGFFKSPRTLGAIQAQLEHQSALRFDVTSLSPAMVRLLRSHALTRSRNSDGQYEYLAAGS